MTTEELKKIYELYDNIVYVTTKWTFTGPAILAGNFVDLCLVGLPKRLIDVTPLMESVPFFKEVTREKEKWYREGSLCNKGFAGVLRATTSIIGEIPFSIFSAVIGALLTALHVVISCAIGVPARAVWDFAANNMFGA